MEIGNGHSHCMSMLLGSAGESIPVGDGDLCLGTWQRVLFIELDRERDRAAGSSRSSAPSRFLHASSTATGCRGASGGELEDPEVAPHHVDGDVVDRHRADAALEAAVVGVAVQDEVGPVLGDRRRHPLGAEERPEPLRLALERLRDRRVVQQRDPDLRAAIARGRASSASTSRVISA